MIQAVLWLAALVVVSVVNGYLLGHMREARELAALAMEALRKAGGES